MQAKLEQDEVEYLLLWRHHILGIAQVTHQHGTLAACFVRPKPKARAQNRHWVLMPGTWVLNLWLPCGVP